jgi:fluoroquinolone transport system permease protein
MSLVFAPRRVGRLVASDAVNVSRDPMLVFASVMALFPSIGLFLFRDAIDAAAFGAFGLADLSRYLVPVAITLPAFLVGWVAGFLFLEDRDDGPLLAVDVTPVGKGGYVAYRAVLAGLLIATITLPAALVLAPDLHPALALLIALLVAIEGISAAVVLPALARNKVEGLALTKITNLFAAVPLIALVPSGWRYLAGVLPPFWIGDLLGLSPDARMPLLPAVILAIAVHIIVAFGLFRLLARRAG